MTENAGAAQMHANDFVFHFPALRFGPSLSGHANSAPPGRDTFRACRPTKVGTGVPTGRQGSN